MKNSPFTLNCRKQLGRERFREREIKYEKIVLLHLIAGTQLGRFR
jgi:hypothetical protein